MHLSKRKLENDLAQITMIAAKELIELYPASTYQLSRNLVLQPVPW